MALSKQKCHFNDMMREFPFIHPGLEDTVLHSTICNVSFSIGNGGRPAAAEHLQTKKLFFYYHVKSYRF